LIAELRMSFLNSAQVVDAVIAKMEWPDHLNQKFRSIPGPPNGARLAEWDLQDALDWMDSDLGDEKETKRAAVYMVGELRILASQGAASAATASGGTGVAVGSGIAASTAAAAAGGGGDPPGSVSVPDSVPDSGAVGGPIPNPMSFEDNLKLALGRRPAASEPELPRELHLGEYAWTNGKVEIPRTTRGFRKLRADELQELKRRLQAVCRRSPQHHVILLNLMGHDMDDGMMQELAGPIAALKALQVLVLSSKSRPHLCSVYFFMATGAFSLHFYTLQGTTSARLVA